MPTERDKPAPPAKDNRWKLVEATMRRHGHRAHALIETLHSAQEAFGYLEPRCCAARARPARAAEQGLRRGDVLPLLHAQAAGRHTCVVCTGTACYIKGAGAILNAIEKELGIKAGETTPDGKLSLLTARCVGSCGLAPAVVLDGEVLGKLGAARRRGPARGVDAP